MTIPSSYIQKLGISTTVLRAEKWLYIARRCHVGGSDPPHPWWGTMVTQRLQVGKLLLTVVVIDRILYPPTLAQVDSCPRLGVDAPHRTRVILPATYK